MTKFSEGIVGKIRQEHIAPVPRWHYLLKSYAFWMLLGVSLLLGSLSFSVIAHLISIGDLDVLRNLQGSVIVSTVMLLPYFWALFLILSTLVAYYNWKHTQFRYRFRRRWILVFSVALSIFLGSILYAFGMGNAIDKMMIKSLPFYDASKHKARDELWLQPEIGLIMGKVITIDSVENQLIIQDAHGRAWKIDDNVVAPKIKANISKGKIVKIIGKKNGENAIIAKEIRRCGDCQDDEDIDDESFKNADSIIVKKDKSDNRQKEKSSKNVDNDDEREEDVLSGEKKVDESNEENNSKRD